ncbi:A fully functional laccase from the Ligninolytic fungus Pycnoporus Cinnabarinus [Heliocybe sulcata]|uniref:A fully functional laccase from the Ligninolytic fungus Pycnoporus Cinnabarinus n=1 Tax=Heliocybe sulcata TaxID=5364 RepID=A0A5C3MVB8_9AGAM|nr:A fully functional laccase from the Ligninolytic fungus Pycnoporus Cinnabarinus [Heliocybe sulcata]
MSFASFSILLTLALATGTFAKDHITNLDVVNKFISPDGHNRSAVLVNGVFPAPLISAEKGQRFLLNTTDKLDNRTMETSTTIHWHGMLQHKTAWSDGAAWVSQCPIDPGDHFLYNFTSPRQAGTFWYHSHIGTQYCDGLRGPLVIYDPDDPYYDDYDVDDETTVITLADWYHQPLALNQTFPFPTNDATTINGKGRTIDMTYNGTDYLSQIEVEHGKRYRFRLINTSCDPYYNFTIDGHKMTVIEADGVTVESVSEVDQIQIHAGQRYSFILHANQKPANYWVHANPNLGSTVNSNDSSLNAAILRYKSVPLSLPNATVVSTPKKPLLETDLHVRLNESSCKHRANGFYQPLHHVKTPGGCAPGAVDKSFFFNTTFDISDTAFHVNGTTYQNPPLPVMLQILNGNYKAQELLPTGSVYPLPRNSTIEISFYANNTGPSPHPIHLHGHTFWVVRSAGNASYNFDNPVIRDTVSIGNTDSDRTTIRFRTDNPGPWFMHCHIDYHLNDGFAVVMAEEPDQVVATNSPIPKAWYDLCPSSILTGNQTHH